jgi:hypothetical protein
MKFDYSGEPDEKKEHGNENQPKCSAKWSTPQTNTIYSFGSVALDLTLICEPATDDFLKREP